MFVLRSFDGYTGLGENASENDLLYSHIKWKPTFKSPRQQCMSKKTRLAHRCLSVRRAKRRPTNSVRTTTTSSSFGSLLFLISAPPSRYSARDGI